MKKQAFSLYDLEDMQHIPASIRYAGTGASSPSYYQSLLKTDADYYKRRMAERQAEAKTKTPSRSYTRKAEVLPAEAEAFESSARMRGLGGSRIASLQTRNLLASRLGIPLERLTQAQRTKLMSRLRPGERSVGIITETPSMVVEGDSARPMVVADPTRERIFLGDEEIFQDSPYFQYLTKFLPHERRGAEYLHHLKLPAYMYA